MRRAPLFQQSKAARALRFAGDCSKATGQYALTIASGGKWRSFKSEQVVYAILIFSAVVIVVLACLTAFSGLAKEVTIAFVGTVVGGTLTTVAQKLGRL